MSDPSETPWSNDPNASQIPPWLYLSEKGYLAGIFMGTISYGVVVALFFQCMSALLNPVNPVKRGIKWAFVAYTAVMFSFLTIPTGIYLGHLFTVCTNNREFLPGTMGYGCIPFTEANTIAPSVIFPFNQWLADGLLLHRCYDVHSMDYGVMALPCLMYLASVVMGIAFIYANSSTNPNFTTAYLSISLSLNVLLTLMIVVRLIAHIRNVRKATRDSDGSSGLHTAAATVVTVLVESYAIYALALLLYIAPWTFDSWIVSLFSKALDAAQVIAPYLIILRVANRKALTRESISSTANSIRFRS